MKVLATDYDGTLKRGEFITPEDKSAITEWRKAGNLFGIISGRSYSALLEETQNQKVKYDFLICNNGAVIKDQIAQIDLQYTADGKVLEDLVTLIVKNGGHHAAISTGDKRICVDIGRSSRKRPDEHSIDLEQVKLIEYFNQIDTVLDNESLSKAFADTVNSKYGQYVTAHQNGICIDMVPAGRSKPVGLLEYLNLKNIPKSNAITVGDNLNDLSMIIEFNGYAVSNANPAILPYAKKIYKDIATIIQEHI